MSNWETSLQFYKSGAAKFLDFGMSAPISNQQEGLLVFLASCNSFLNRTICAHGCEFSED